MRVVFLGTSAFAGGVLEALAGSPHRPVLVISRPDSRQGRGRHLQPPPAVALARELGIDVEQPQSVNSDQARARIVAAEPEALCVCAFGALIRDPLLSDHPILNVHPSLLPRWRGAAPIERAILAGDERTGVSIMRLEAGLDSGPVCLQEEIPIAPDDDYGSLAARLQELSGRLTIRAFDELAAGTLAARFKEQDASGVTYADKLSAADRELDPAEGAAALARRVRALSPHIGAHVELPDGTRLGVLKASVRVDRDDLLSRGGAIDLNGPLPAVRTRQGTLVLETVQPPGKKPMSGADYLRGRRR